MQDNVFFPWIIAKNSGVFPPVLQHGVQMVAVPQLTMAAVCLSCLSVHPSTRGWCAGAAGWCIAVLRPSFGAPSAQCHSLRRSFKHSACKALQNHLAPLRSLQGSPCASPSSRTMPAAKRQEGDAAALKHPRADSLLV